MPAATARDHPRLPSLEGLRAFEAAARLGSFERAADELALTASAIGKRIATVEELLGTALFSRNAKPLVLTAAGREYLERVRPAIGMLLALPQHQRAHQRSRRLRVVAPPTFARQILVPHLYDFTRRHADVELEVVLSIPYLDSPPPPADVQVRHGLPPDAARVLMHDLVLPLAAPSLLARSAPLNSPADLRQQVLLRTPIEPWAPWFSAARLDWPEPAGGPKLVDLGLTLEAAVQGQGIALARPSLARAWLEAGSLMAPFTIAARPAAQYHLAAVADDDAAQAFAAWLHERCLGWQRAAHALLPSMDSASA
jgi:LysR family transcriptional regulator, glycine cleavage system transcriptional activator